MSSVLEHRRNATNLLALAAIQLGNALLPLIGYPLILAAVGADAFAPVAVTEALTMIVLAIMIYSFDVDGVSQVAVLNPLTDQSAISAIFSEILITRLLILGVVVTGLLVSAPLLDRTTFRLLLAWMLFPLGYALQGAWFFQAFERNVFPGIATVISRLVCVVLIRRTIATPADIIHAPLLVGGASAIAGLATLLYAIAGCGIRLGSVRRARIIEGLRHGRALFFGNISVALYRDSNVLILKALSTSTAVSTYAIAEKLVKVFQAGARPLNQLFFPKVVRALREIGQIGMPAFRSVLRHTIPQFVLLAMGIVTLLVGVVFGRHYLPSSLQLPNETSIVRLIAVMSISVFFGVANFMFGTAGLNFLGGRRRLAVSILQTGLCSVVCSSILVSFFGALGAAVSFSASEILLFLLICRTYGLLPLWQRRHAGSELAP